MGLAIIESVDLPKVDTKKQVYQLIQYIGRYLIFEEYQNIDIEKSKQEKTPIKGIT